MGSAAQRNEAETEALFCEGAGAAVSAPDNGLKQVVAERLAAHRERRAAEHALKMKTAQMEAAAKPARTSTRIRDAVAARYEQSVSYREFLAAEAERSLQQAQAEAEMAARKAVAVAEAKMQLMEELEHWNRTEAEQQQVEREIVRQEKKAEVRGELAHALADIALGAKELMEEPMAGGLTVRLYNDAVMAPGPVMEWSRESAAEVSEDAELRELEQEIAFRLAPEMEPFVADAQPIPGNLIEFPRQLVAPRKARPRLAEGPLREDAPVEPQLRIFEVEPEQISVEPAPLPTAAPEWQSLLLEATTTAARALPAEAQMDFTLPLQTASLELRVMAAAVDFAWIGAAFVSFATIAVKLAGPSLKALPLPLVGVSAALVLAILYVTYEVLFFSLTGTTPGMSYARIGLCTFGDRNPTRKAMRMRVLATILAACPLGLGLAWAWLDEERLGWHDRMSRMYQRAY